MKLRPFVLLSIVGCGRPSPSPSVAPSRALSFEGDTVPSPPPKESFRRHDHRGKPYHLAFLNFDGAPLECTGNDDSRTNESTVACDPSPLFEDDFPAFDPTGYQCDGLDSCKSVIRDAVQERWIDWNITFVTERPESGNYEMVMVGGGGLGGVLGVAPLDCGDTNPNGVSFAFSDDIRFVDCTNEVLVTTISQELAHSLGLCHNDDLASIMFPAVTKCDQQWTCGSQADSCLCGGTAYDPYCPPDYLDQLLGDRIDDLEPPTVSILSPRSGEVIPRNFTVLALAEDNVIVVETELIANGQSAGRRTDRGESGAYEWEAQAYQTGEAEFCVVARDFVDNEATDCVRVEVSADATCDPSPCCCGNNCCGGDCGCSTYQPTGAACGFDNECQGQICLADPATPEETVCTEPCKPEDSCAQDTQCPPGHLCDLIDGRDICWPFAVAGAPGYPCVSNEQCDSGLCIGINDAGDTACAVLCDPADGDACADDFVCGVGEGRRNVCLYDCHSGDSGGCGCRLGTRPRTNWSPALLLFLLLARRRLVF